MRDAGQHAAPRPFTSLGAQEADATLFTATLAAAAPEPAVDTLVSLLRRTPRLRLQGPARPRIDAGLVERHPLRILLAEDNVVNQKLSRCLLAQMGYRADVASNGIEAIECVARQPYDVVLMDADAEMDGLEASRRITAQWAPDDRPRIVAM